MIGVIKGDASSLDEGSVGAKGAIYEDLMCAIRFRV